MQLIKGTLSLLGDSIDNLVVLVIDAEIFYKKNYKLFKLGYDVELTEIGTVLAREIPNIVKRNGIDEVYMLSLQSEMTFADKYLSLMFPQQSITPINSEKDYKLFVQVKKPLIHLAVQLRQNYYKNSVFVTSYLYGEQNDDGESKEKSISRGGKL